MLCPFCLIDFDVIGRMENFAQDSKFIAESLGVSHLLKLGTHERQSLEATTDVEFFSRVNRSVVQRLVKVYEMDFLAFGYSPRPFYAMTREG